MAKLHTQASDRPLAVSDNQHSRIPLVDSLAARQIPTRLEVEVSHVVYARYCVLIWCQVVSAPVMLNSKVIHLEQPDRPLEPRELPHLAEITVCSSLSCVV